MSDSVQPHRRQPIRLPRPWDSPGKNTGVGCHFLHQCMKVKSESEVAQSCPTLATPWTAAYQAPPSRGFSRQKYWSGVPLPSPVYCHSACLTYMQCTTWEMQSEARIKIVGRNIKNLRYAYDTTLMAESEEELKRLLRVKEESEKTGLKLNIKK